MQPAHTGNEFYTSQPLQIISWYPRCGRKLPSNLGGRLQAEYNTHVSFEAVRSVQMSGVVVGRVQQVIAKQVVQIGKQSELLCAMQDNPVSRVHR